MELNRKSCRNKEDQNKTHNSKYCHLALADLLTALINFQLQNQQLCYITHCQYGQTIPNLNQEG
jgi:hypothetical protein